MAPSISMRAARRWWAPTGINSTPACGPRSKRLKVGCGERVERVRPSEQVAESRRAPDKRPEQRQRAAAEWEQSSETEQNEARWLSKRVV
jgi:hypothetical protein